MCDTLSAGPSGSCTGGGYGYEQPQVVRHDLGAEPVPQEGGRHDRHEHRRDVLQCVVRPELLAREVSDVPDRFAHTLPGA